MFRNISRNLKMYFRDRTSVFFSLLAVLIVIVLYILFLAQVQIDSVKENTNGLIDSKTISYLINSWILAGLLSITTVTSTLGAFGTMVGDYEEKKMMDFKSSPMKPWEYPITQILAAFCVGTIISLISFAIYGGYICLDTGYRFELEQIVKCVGLVLLSSFMSASLMGLVVSFLKTNSAFSSVSLVIGTVIGFVNGLYVPMGTLPDIVQKMIKCLPFAHIASLFRQVLMKGAIDETFKDMSQTVEDQYMENYGVYLKWGSDNITFETSCIFIIVVMVVSLGAFFVSYNRKKKEV